LKLKRTSYTELSFQADAFLCSVNDVSVTSTVEPRPRNIEIGAEMILKQKLRGQGMAFLVGGGSVMQKILAPREVITVDAACIVAMTTTINFQLKSPNQLRRAVFGGDNQLTASLTGPGVVFLQSLPFQRLSQRIARYEMPYFYCTVLAHCRVYLTESLFLYSQAVDQWRDQV
jgi:uncharacterized protein (AIM24 family)